jgi:hypothetical protein
MLPTRRCASPVPAATNVGNANPGRDTAGVVRLHHHDAEDRSALVSP